MKNQIWVGVAFVSLGALGVAAAQEKPAADETGMVSVTPATVKWVDGPPSLPKGAKMAVLHGDPSKPGLFVMRAKLPANYKIPAHWHPADEILTIVSGTFFLGHGDKLDPAAGKPYPGGSFISMPAKMHHFAYTKKETIIQLSTMGPWAINYINPADDPRTTAAATK